MPRVPLLHWNASEAQPTIELLTRAGFQVEYHPACSAALMRDWRQNPPTAFVIDLSRLPSYGKEIAIALRQSPKTKQIPIVFHQGAPKKCQAIQALLPDAAFCTARSLIKTLKAARPAETPAQPAAMMNRYGTRTTAQKLGIIEGSTVALLNPPRNLTTVLGPLPAQVEFTEQSAAVTLCFIYSVDGLRSEISSARTLAAKTRLWILWRKKTSSSHNGVTDVLVRETALDLGLVDYKICSLDKDWTGMLFALKKP